jgi:hypothetical protein
LPDKGLALAFGRATELLLLQIGYACMKDLFLNTKANVQAALRPAGRLELWRLAAGKSIKTVVRYQ